MGGLPSVQFVDSLVRNIMSTIRIQESRVVDAKAEAIYAVLADYRVGHPAILPKPYFTSMIVEKGGIGTGTEISGRIKVLGVEQVFRGVISEPEPGRILVEADPQAGTTTTFTLEPLSDSSQTRVTITTEMKASPGFKGLMERLMTPAIMRRIYREELQNLAGYMSSKRALTPAEKGI